MTKTLNDLNKHLKAKNIPFKQTEEFTQIGFVRIYFPYYSNEITIVDQRCNWYIQQIEYCSIHYLISRIFELMQTITHFKSGSDLVHFQSIENQNN